MHGSIDGGDVPAAMGRVLTRAAAMALPLDVEKLVRSVGLDIRFQSDLSSAVSGYLWRGSARPVIVVNARRPKVRQRFTIAHELTHWAFSDPGICFKLRESREGYEGVEHRADRYASELLMPAEAVKDAWASEKSAWQQMRAFGVSHAALLLRLYELGLVGAEGDSYDSEYVQALADV